MDDTEKPEFANAIAALFETFRTEVTEPLMRGYWYGLKDFEFKTVEFAVIQALRQSKRFLPTPAELRELSGEQSPEQRAVSAWTDVLRAIPLGPYKHVNFSDGVINATIRNMGGWPNFLARFTNAESEKWVRIEFLRAYGNLSHLGVNGEMCEALTGLAEVSIVRNGLKSCKSVPVRIECTATDTPRLRQTTLFKSVPKLNQVRFTAPALEDSF